MLTEEDYNRLEADLARCRSCGRSMSGNRGIRTCDGCGTQISPIPVTILKRLMAANHNPDPRRPITRGTVLGYPYYGVGR